METGGVVRLLDDFAWKPEEVKIIISSFPMGELYQEFYDNLLLMLLLSDFLLAAVDRRGIVSRQRIGGGFQRGLIDRRRRNAGEVGVVVRRTLNTRRLGNDSVRSQGTEVGNRFDRMLLGHGFLRDFPRLFSGRKQEHSVDYAHRLRLRVDGVRKRRRATLSLQRGTILGTKRTIRSFINNIELKLELEGGDAAQNGTSSGG